MESAILLSARCAAWQMKKDGIELLRSLLFADDPLHRVARPSSLYICDASAARSYEIFRFRLYPSAE